MRSPAKATPPPADTEPLGRTDMRIAMLLHKSVAHDTRVQREASALAEAGHELTVVHLPAPGKGPEPNGQPFGLTPATLQRNRERLPRPIRLGAEATRLARRAAAIRPDVIHAHDAAMLLPGLLAARRSGARLIYDSHELATGVPYRGGAWPSVVAAVERFGAPRADAVITVSDGIATRLRERYALRATPTVIRNVPDLPPPGAAQGGPPVPDLRHELGVNGSPLILHQGAVAAGRGCKTLVRAVSLLPDAHLLFLGGEGPYVEHIRMTAWEAGVGDRTHLLEPVPPEALLAHTAQADIGVSLLEDSCENHRLALPNKLFEYLAAGLPVIVSDLPEAASLVRARGIGWCTDPADPGSVATTLRTALAQRDDAGLRTRLEQAATELSWENEKQGLLAVYETLANTALRTAAESRR